MTASSLIGKRVVDREGQEIGKVKDVGLNSVAPHLGPTGAAAADNGRSEARLLVRVIRSLDTEGDLVAIPASQVQREGDMLRVDVSRGELRSMIGQNHTSEPVSMNRK